MKMRKSTITMTAAERNTVVSMFKHVMAAFISGVAAIDDFANEHAVAISQKKRYHTRGVHSRGEDREQRALMFPTSHRGLLNHLFNRLAHRFSPVIATVGLVLITLAASLAHGQSTGDELKSLSIAELKRGYLLCNYAAISGRLNSAAIPQCSILYEELKQRAFGGDFYKLLAWSKAQRSAPVTGR
jgi:hypothetical protein